MNNFKPQIGLVTQECYLHGCGQLENIGCPAVIVYVGEKYFVLEDMFAKTAFVVNEENYWVINEGDFT